MPEKAEPHSPPAHSQWPRAFRDPPDHPRRLLAPRRSRPRSTRWPTSHGPAARLHRPGYRNLRSHCHSLPEGAPNPDSLLLALPHPRYSDSILLAVVLGWVVTLALLAARCRLWKVPQPNLPRAWVSSAQAEAESSTFPW